jgi:hypothetical protein
LLDPVHLLPRAPAGHHLLAAAWSPSSKRSHQLVSSSIALRRIDTILDQLEGDNWSWSSIAS